MYRKTEDFLSDWDYEYKSTLKMIEHVSDEALDVSFNGEVRKISRLIWHMTLTIGEMLHKAGLIVDCPPEDAPLPATKKIQVESYKKAAESALELIKANWNDNTLLLKDNMYGEEWEKGKTLQVLILHQAHHRGQLTVLMRMAGCKVPGIYGPAKEEWVQMGLPVAE